MAGSAYDDDDEDEEAELAGEDSTWTEEEEVNDEGDGKDESSAYLEFLNEEVCPHRILTIWHAHAHRPRSSGTSKMTLTTSWVKKASLRLLWTRSNHTNFSEMRYSVSFIHVLDVEECS